MDQPAESPGATATELAVNGMTCSNCARHVTEAIQGVPGVASATVRLEAGRATVRWQAAPDVPAVVAAVGEAGYDAKPVDAAEAAGGPKSNAWSPLAG